MDSHTKSNLDAWLADPAVDDAAKQEIRALLAAGREAELTDRFYCHLEFGTGGLRGILGAGTNRMNVYTVGAAAQGMAGYIRKAAGRIDSTATETNRPSVAIAYDCRRMSEAFGRRVASVMAANGITAHLFPAPRPTPHLSFAIRRLGCTAGVVITASHNPPEYNGFKAYWEGGGQVVPPHDNAIIEEVRRVGSYSNIRDLPFEQGVSGGLINVLDRSMDEAFLDAVSSSCLNPEACRRQGAKMKIVYTNLHGTGGALIPEALRRRGFQHVIEVPEQAKPDGEFPTVKSPNPEEPAALELAIRLAVRQGADLVIGTDPDADRMGIAVRTPDGAYTPLTGNQIGALLAYYLCEELTRAHRFPENAVVISTIVSSDMMKEIGRAYGAEVVETLTGFKWIAAKIREYELAGGPDGPVRQYLFGAEESYGYMPCTYVRDKDAVTSAACIAELAAVAAEQGRSLHGLLEDLFRRFGYFQEGARSIAMPGKDGAERIRAIMRRLRQAPPATLGGQAVAYYADIQTGEKKELPTGKVVGRCDLPPSDVIVLTLADETKVIARPSGTEPKIKFYILARRPGADLAAARAGADAAIRAISEDLSRLTSS